MEYRYDESDIMHIYEWVDYVSLSRPKKNIARDFSDGVLTAELIKYHLPKLIELHNYPTAHSTTQKINNWNTLKLKVFKKLGLIVTKNEIDDVIACKHMAIENLLKRIYDKIQKYKPDVNEEKEELQNSPYKDGNEKQPFLSNDSCEVGSREHFYKSQLQERESIIQDLKISLENCEMKIKKSDEDKIFLQSKLKEYSETVKQYGLI